jgi:hypothetical protein
MPNQKSNFFSLLKHILHFTDLSESFIDRISSHYAKLSPEQEQEAIKIFKESIQSGLIQLLNIGRPSFILNVTNSKSNLEREQKKLNSLAQCYCETLPKIKNELFEKWILHIQETANRTIGKQRLDVLLILFEKKSITELKQEIDFRINIGQTGLFLNENTNITEKESKSSSNRNDYFKKIAENNERVGKELAKEKSSNNDQEHSKRLF